MGDFGRRKGEGGKPKMGGAESAHPHPHHLHHPDERGMQEEGGRFARDSAGWKPAETIRRTGCEPVFRAPGGEQGAFEVLQLP
jgi:hypothetical protein